MPIMIPPGAAFSTSTGFSYVNSASEDEFWNLDANETGTVTFPDGSQTIHGLGISPIHVPPPPAPAAAPTYVSPFTGIAPEPITSGTVDQTVTEALNKWWAKQKIKEVKKMPTDQEKFYNKPLKRLFRFGKQSGEIGLEIECEGTHLFNSPFVWWGCHGDGSLRDVEGHPPVEYVLKKPLDYEDLVKALVYLEKKLVDAGSSVVKSTRTSVHVHINVQDLTLRQLYCFILLYIIFEELLVDWSGPDRIGNLFCLRAKDSDFYVSMLEHTLKKEDFKHWKEEYRYSACNIASVPKFGSLEFRSLRGTVDIQLILMWVQMLRNIRDKSLKYDNPIDIVNDFIQMGPLPFFKHIFGEADQRHELEVIPGLSGKLWDGLRIMRDIAHCSEWLAPLPKKNGEPEEQEPEGPDPNYPRVGDRIWTQWGDRWVKAVHRDMNMGSLRYWIVEGLNATPNDRYQYTVPLGCTMYYVDQLPPQYAGCWCSISVRDGGPEIASANPNLMSQQ